MESKGKSTNSQSGLKDLRHCFHSAPAVTTITTAIFDSGIGHYADLKTKPLKDDTSYTGITFIHFMWVQTSDSLQNYDIKSCRRNFSETILS